MNDVILHNAKYLLTNEHKDVNSLRFKFEQEFVRRTYIVIGGGKDEFEYIFELMKNGFGRYFRSRFFFIEVCL